MSPLLGSRDEHTRPQKTLEITLTRFSTQAEETLTRAGWYPARPVPDLVASWRETLLRSDGIAMFPSAEKALLEFGGLKIDQQGLGVTCSREPFEIDPTLAVYEGETFVEFSTLVDARLYH